MKADHGRSLALSLGRRLCVVALAYVSLTAGAVNSGNIGRASISGTGKSTTVGPVTNSGGSTIPVSPSVGGWTQAGNYGVPPAATGQTVAIVTPNGQTVVGGSAQKYPFSASYSIPWATVAGVAAGVICTVTTAGVCGVATVAAAASPFIMDWIGKAGMYRNSDTGAIETPQVDSSWPQSDGYQWMVQLQGAAYRDTKEEACRLAVPLMNNSTYRFEYDHITTTGGPTAYGQCFAKSIRISTGVQDSTPSIGNFVKGVASGCPLGWYKTPAGCVSPANLPRVAASVSQIADAMSKVVPDPRVWGETLEKGGEIPFPNPTVTGPSAIQGPEKTTTNPDGSRTVERTQYNFQTSGNTINNTSNVTTVTTYNADNSVRNVTTSTTTPTAEQKDPDDPCEKRPNSVGCQELEDPPKTDIPKSTKTITYAEEAGIGGGSCPADVMWSPQSVAGTYKFINWQQACGWAASLKWLVILLATWAAFWIVMPGNTQVKPQ